jgi:hypothetical protein
MTDSFGVTAQVQSQMGPGNSLSEMTRMLTGRITAAPAFPYGGVSGVVVSSNDSQCIVTIDGFDSTGQSTFTCAYQPVPGSENPPAGTPCFVAFAANGDHSPWVTAFGGWPT